MSHRGGMTDGVEFHPGRHRLSEIMARQLQLYLCLVVALGAAGLVATTLLFPVSSQIGLALPGLDRSSDLARVVGIAFWTATTLIASALPVELPSGINLGVAMAPIIAATALGGPAVGAFVAAIGTTEVREVRGRIPWYGTLANHAGLVIPAVAAGVFIEQFKTPDLATDFVRTVAGAALFFLINAFLAASLAALRRGDPILPLFASDLRSFTVVSMGLVAMAWLMAVVYESHGWWAAALFAVPLYTTRLANHRFVEMREMFTQTIQSLANAVDKRDPHTANHSHRVMLIASDIGREMRCSDSEMEALEWGGLLHDVGKIGVRDEILLKQDRLTREERMKMNAHPELGAEIIAPVRRLAPELPIIRHHHEWYNGSGYPDRLIGDEIPKLARLLHVADAFEAMTASRPYRMTPLTNEQALGELRKFAGIQFDPQVVDAFVRTKWVEGVSDPGRIVEPRPIPLISQVAGRGAQATANAPDRSMAPAAALAGPTPTTAESTASAPTN